MRKITRIASCKWLIVATLFTFCIPGFKADAQQLRITDFAVFGGNPTCAGPGQTLPNSPGCAVQFGSSTVINGGAVGSYGLVTSTGNLTVNGSIYRN